MTHTQRFWLLVYRALRLKCPFCGVGTVFRGFFVTEPKCPHCGRVVERESGFFLGSIYFNYGLTALITAIAYPVLLFVYRVDDTQLQIGILAFAIFFPMWFFRYARSLWLGFDQFADPREGTLGNDSKSDAE